MTDYFASVRNKPTLTAVPDAEARVTTIVRDGIHPYAAAAVAAELDRLDRLPRPWAANSYWDQTTFDVACNLLEIANSPWSGYSLADAENDLYAHAPADSRWGRREHEKKWESARDRIGAGSRPEPSPGEEYVVPSVSLLEPHDEPDGDPFARFNLIDWHALKHEEDKGEEWIVEPIISAGRMVALYSPPKAGKSLLVLELVAAAALGRPVLGRPAQEPVSVLYIDFENDPRGDIKPRLEDMGYDLEEMVDHLHVATFPSIAKLDTPQGGMDVLYIARHVGARLVVIDTVSRTVGGEENDNNTWLSFYRNTGIPLKREGIACIRLDHTGKDREKGMRGGSAKYGDVDAVWRLLAASETVLELDCTDHRMSLDTTHLTLVRHTDPLRHEVSGDPFAVAMDAKEKDLADTLDRLDIPTDWGRDKVRKLLEEHGLSATNTLLSRVIKARKSVLQDLSADRSRTGPDRNLSPRLSGTPHRGPAGGQVLPVRDGQGQVASGDLQLGADDEAPPMFLVACRKCYSPTHRDVATGNDGLCPNCARLAGLDHRRGTEPETNQPKEGEQ